MNSMRHISVQSINHSLFQSLRKQRELSNRVNVLLVEREKKLKLIENTIKEQQMFQDSKIQKSLRKQEIQRSFQKEKRAEIYSNHIFRELRNELGISIHHKKQAILQSRNELYQQMKKSERDNLKKIHNLKDRQIILKRNNHNKIQLMELNSKKNIKKYWNQRAEINQEAKHRDVLEKTILLEHSQSCIRQLQTKEQNIIKEISCSQNIEDCRNINLQDFVEQSQIMHFPEININPYS